MCGWPSFLTFSFRKENEFVSHEERAVRVELQRALSTHSLITINRIKMVDQLASSTLLLNMVPLILLFRAKQLLKQSHVIVEAEEKSISSPK